MAHPTPSSSGWRSAPTDPPPMRAGAGMSRSTSTRSRAASSARRRRSHCQRRTRPAPRSTCTRQAFRPRPTASGSSWPTIWPTRRAWSTVRTTVTVGTHPNAEALDAAAHRLYVANGDSDQVSVVETSTDQVVSTINLAPYSNANVGTNPTGLTLSPDGHTLYVANSGNNDVDVIKVASGQVMGS